MRLPDIDYQPGNVRPLAKADDKLPLRKAQIEIDLSKVKLGAALDLAGQIGQAGVSLARQKLAVEKDRIHSEAQFAIDLFNHRTQMKAAKRNMNLKLVNDAVQIGAQIVSAYAGYQQNQGKAEVSSAKLNLAKEMGQFQFDNAGVTAYSADSLPKGLYRGETVIEKPDGSSKPIQLSRNEIYPDLWFKHAQDSIERNANLISNDALREEFKQMANIDVNEGYLSMISDATKAQHKEIIASQDAQIGALFEEGQYGLAGKYLEETSLPEATKIEYRSKIGIAKEEAGLHKLHASDNVNQLFDAAQHLESDAYKGKLDAASRFGWSQKLKVKVEKIRQTSMDLNRALRSEATDVSKMVLDDMIQGKNLDRSKIEEVIQYAQKNGADETVIHNLKKEASQLYVNQLFHNVDAAGRADIIRNLDNSATTPAGRILAQRYARENDRITKALREDPLQYVADQDLYEVEPFKPSDPNFWRTRKIQSIAAADRFKVKVPLMTADEAQRVADQFEASTPEQKVEMVQGFQTVLGDDADKVFDQIGAKEPSFRVLSLVDKRTATEALSGAQIRKEYPAAVPKRGDLQLDMTDHFGNALVTSPKMREGLEQFTMDLYAARASKAGNMTGGYDTKVMKDVLKQIPLVEYNDQTFISPADGVDSKAFKDWLKYAEPKSLIGGKVPHMDDAEVVENIHSGSFTMIQNGRSEWLLLDTETGRLVSTDGKRPFILKYDPNIPYRGTMGFPYDKEKKKTVGEILHGAWDNISTGTGLE